MEFFVDNWLWFLVAGIVILMTIIGYIAEKTDFGRKDMPKVEKPKKEKKDKKKESKAKQPLTEVLEVEEPKPEVQMSLATDSILEEPFVQEESTDVENFEDLNVSFGDVSFEQPTSQEELASEPVLELTNSNKDELFTEPVIQPEITTEETLEDLNVPFGDVSFEQPTSQIEEVVEAEPTEELNLDDVSMPNIELPDLDAIVTEEDTDDVWKF